MKKFIALSLALMCVVMCFAACAKTPEFTAIKAEDVEKVTNTNTATAIDAAEFAAAYNESVVKEYVFTGDVLDGDETMLLVILKDKSTFPVYILDANTILIADTEDAANTAEYKYYTAKNSALAGLCK